MSYSKKSVTIYLLCIVNDLMKNNIFNKQNIIDLTLGVNKRRHDWLHVIVPVRDIKIFVVQLQFNNITSTNYETVVAETTF